MIDMENEGGLKTGDLAVMVASAGQREPFHPVFVVDRNGKRYLVVRSEVRDSVLTLYLSDPIPW